jgi:pimeloyl-ACP methyl ester carboxylesterase
MNTELFYTDNGSENGLPPIILLHGNGGNSSSFFYVSDYFSKFRRVIAIDTRGHGRSKRGDAPFTLKQFSLDLYNFMLSKEIKKAVLIGYSDGGNIAMIFATEHPEMVSAMVLNGANMFPKGLMKKDYKWIMRDYKKTCRRLKFRPNDKELIQKAELLGLMANEPNLTPEDFKEINAPVLVLVGSRDVILPEHTKLICSSFKNSTLAVVEGGHNIVKTNSLPYIEAVDEFLKSVK